MTDLPILFSAPMVRALLREIEHPGTGKTQTRRVLTKLRRFGPILEFERSDTPGYAWHFRDRGLRWHDLRHTELTTVLPYQIGDRLYVREAWRVSNEFDGIAPREIAPITRVRFEADMHMPSRLVDIDAMTGKFRQGMHMPRWASRLTLIVTDVRVQRLQEISEADAIAEGVERLHDGFFPYSITTFMTTVVDGREVPAQYCPTACGSFRLLWDSLNADRGYGWDANPWVAAYTFRPILGNIDQVRP